MFFPPSVPALYSARNGDVESIQRLQQVHMTVAGPDLRGCWSRSPCLYRCTRPL